MVVPVGAILAYSAEKAPNGWLKCNGDVFDKTAYPLLAKLHPSGRTPDLRGEFIRGWDDRRNIDSGRKLLSAQTDAIGVMRANNNMNIRSVFVNTNWSAEYPATDAINGIEKGGSFSDPASSVSRAFYRAATETRPRNIAFNYIVRAA